MRISVVHACGVFVCLSAAIAGNILGEIDGSGRNRAARSIDEALILSAHQGDAEEMERLLDNGADPNAINVLGEHVISLAAEAPVTSRTNAMLTTGECICIARRRSYAPMIKLLLRRGARTDVRNRFGLSPVDQASSMDEPEITSVLRRLPQPAVVK